MATESNVAPSFPSGPSEETTSGNAAPDTAAENTAETQTASPDAGSDTSDVNDFSAVVDELESVDDGDVGSEVLEETPPETPGDGDDTTPPDDATGEDTPPDTEEETPQETDTTPDETSEEVDTPTEVSPDELQAQRDQRRQEALDYYTERYQLSEEISDALLVNPGEALPQIAAELHLRVLDSAMQAMQQMLPNLIQQIGEQDKQRDAFKQDIVKVWPKLEDPKLMNEFFAMVPMYVQQYGNQDPGQMIQTIGGMVALKHGFVPEGNAGAGAGGGEQPPTNQPHTPASQRPSTVTPAPVKQPGSGNIFSDIANEDLEFDQS